MTKNFREVLHLAITDSYEFIRRTSVRMMQHVGLNEYVYPQIKAYVEDNLSERVAFNVSLGLQVFDQAAVQAAIDKVMAETMCCKTRRRCVRFWRMPIIVVACKKSY